MRRLAILAAVLATPAAADTTLEWRTIPELHTIRKESPLAAASALSGIGADRSRLEAELRSTWRGVTAVVTARSIAQDGLKPDNGIVVNECHYDGTIGGQRISIGKKILSWDVGFGFRPLDVMQQEDRRALFATTLEGIPVVAWERFDSDTAWLLVLANPGRGRARDARDDESFALKFYRRDGDTDWHALVRHGRRNRLEAGFAFVRVAADGIEWHGSILHQQRHERLWNPLADGGPPLATGNPLVSQVRSRGRKALVGATWTGESGLSILGEAWYDGSAYTAAEWRAIGTLARRQASLAGLAPDTAVRGNLAYDAQLFATANPLRKNLLLRLSHRDAEGRFQPALDILHTPEDGGRVITASLGYRDGRFRLDAGLRVFGGSTDAAYRLLPERRAAYLALSFSL